MRSPFSELVDVHDKATRSRNMAAIRGSDTKPEMMIRRGLHARGFRFRLHDRKLPGRPDLIFPRHRAVLFVHGCFWHGHGCHLFKWPSTREDFWRQKIGANVARDETSKEALHDLQQQRPNLKISHPLTSEYVDGDWRYHPVRLDEEDPP